jgi:hypothetical protein
MTSISLIQNTVTKPALWEKVNTTAILRRPWLVAILYEPGYVVRYRPARPIGGSGLGRMEGFLEVLGG